MIDFLNILEKFIIEKSSILVDIIKSGYAIIKSTNSGNSNPTQFMSSGLYTSGGIIGSSGTSSKNASINSSNNSANNNNNAATFG